MAKSSKTGLIVLVAVLVVAAVAVTLALVLGHNVGRSTNVDNISVGDCFNLPDSTGTSANDSTISQVTVINCDSPHYGEVFLNEPSDGMTDAKAEQTAQQLCPAAFGQYVGRDYGDSIYDVGFMWPKAGATKSYFTCYIVSTDGSLLTGSAKGTRQ